jgi:hypothetical protein
MAVDPIVIEVAEVLTVLQPKPVPVVQMRAFDAPEHPGMVYPAGVPALTASSTWFAESAARLAYGSDPVTPVDKGRPVAFVRVIAVGVSRAGAVNDGELARTGTPVPVPVTPWIVVEFVQMANCPAAGVPALTTSPVPVPTATPLT